MSKQHDASDVNHIPSRRRDIFSGVMLAGGALAWLIALVVVAFVSKNDEPPVPERILVQTTLAAETSTPLPAVTLLPTLVLVPTTTGSPTLMPNWVPSATPTVIPFVVITIRPTLMTTLTPIIISTPASPAPVESEAAGIAAEPTLVAAANTCTPPEEWERYVVQPDDTLFAFVLGAEATLSVDDIIAANCLSSRYLQIDQVIYLPPGAAENAPPSAPYVSAAELGVLGPRVPNCPCSIRIAAGWRLEQIAEAITASETSFTGGDFLTVTGSGASAPFDFVMARPPGTSMEGFLFPGTYTVQNDTTVTAFRDMVLAAFGANVSSQLRTDAAAQGLNFYQALIIASVVQREVHGPEAQKLVSSVYHNLYNDGNRLGTTVAVQYALGTPGNWWPRVTASGLKVDSPYNAYTHSGLPPTPIDSPGLSAIIAAVYPAQTEYRFHTASCDGSGEAFAVTYAEHLKNVNCE